MGTVESFVRRGMKFTQVVFISSVLASSVLASVCQGFGFYGKYERRSSLPAQTSVKSPTEINIDDLGMARELSASSILMRILKRIEKIRRMKQAEEDTRERLLRGKIGLKLPMLLK